MVDGNEKSTAGTSEPHPGVTITPVTQRDVDASLRKLNEATAPFFRREGPLAAHENGNYS
jgi:hypothetical protein